jgi:O-methyltransferase involved in polyketide biosynthesis
MDWRRSGGEMTEAEQAPSGVDTATPTPARLYDYYLGGTNNFAVDREAAEALRASLPELMDAAWANRGFHQRAASWMAAEHGIRQFIDLGSGLPTQGNTHEAVSQVTPAARVVYVDHDPMVLAHARALLSGTNSTTVIQADLRDPAVVLSHPALRALIDCSQPAGLLMTAVLHFVADESDPRGLVAQYTSQLAPGSYVALSHATADRLPPQAVQAMYDTYSRATEKIHLRSKADFERLFGGLELVAPFDGANPGVTFVGKWGAEDPGAADSDGSRVLYCGVARRP